jgi:phospholipid/cholesterol/gamma-HCH transport system substrate-binding protein
MKTHGGRRRWCARPACRPSRSARRRRSDQRGWALPACAALSTVVLGGCALSLQSLPKLTSSSGSTYPIHADFANVLNLPDDAQVRLGAQVVGLVGTIATKNFQADLVLDIDKTVHLPVGTTAQIRFDNPLGDEYVLLQAPAASSPSSGTAPVADRFLPPGATIAESDTSTAASVEDTFGALSLVLNGGGLNQLQVIIHELNDTFNNNQPQIRSFLVTIEHAVRSLAGGRAAIDAALSSIGNLTKKLDAGRGTIAKGIATIAPAIGVLSSENSQLSSLLKELSSLGVTGTRIAVQSGQVSVEDAKDLLPVVRQLQSVSQQLGPDLSELAAFEAETPKLAPGAYLQVSVIANVLLPRGGFEPTPLGSTTSAPPLLPTSTGQKLSGGTGSAAVSSLLEDGLL